MAAATVDNRRAMPRPTREPDSNRYSGRVSEVLRKEREARGMSVEDMAAKITSAGYEVAAPTLYHWENGNRQPSLDALPYIAKALRVKLLDLLPPK